MTQIDIIGSPPQGHQWRSIKNAAVDLGLAERTVRRKIAADELVSRATGNKRTDQKFVAVPSDKIRIANDASGGLSSDMPDDNGTVANDKETSDLAIKLAVAETKLAVAETKIEAAESDKAELKQKVKELESKVDLLNADHAQALVDLVKHAQPKTLWHALGLRKDRD